uniref:E3 ubiquitin-protein ligase n=1 Tax=Phytophthora ramorum TaxID=164328 RepID=H3HBR5_PHYRM
MVAIRGKKAKASAKPKAVEKASKAKVAAAAKEVASPTRLTQQQQLTRRREQEFVALARFALQSNLARGAGLCRNCQLDTTCVMCKDCFTHSDHAGHDVYFQRTTAGSSCDCGDLHAWKQSGFCSKHKGAGVSGSGAKKHKLPKHVGLMAPIVIETVVEHIYQVLLGVDYGFELAQAFELFTRDIPPQLLPIQSDTDVADASESRSSGRLEAQAKEVKCEPNSSNDGRNDGVRFGIRLHNDDVHSLTDVISHLYVELEISKTQAPLIGGDKDIFTWASEQEASQRRRFDFRAEGAISTVTSAGFLAEGNRVSCKNIFIEEFVKAVSLSPSYRRHESVRKSFDAVKAVERSHSFLREHLVDINFRASMLEAYLRSYASMTSMFLRGLGNSTESIFDFAVQFLTVPHLVQSYTKKEAVAHPGRPELVRELLCALHTVFQSAVEKEGALNADHAALSSQKYKHCVENMEYVFNIGPTLSSELVCNADNLKIWLSCLSILQIA